jgi:hypothetical protein
MDESLHSSDAGPRKDAFSRALSQLDRIRDAVVRSSQIGKIKLDATFLRRERDRLVKQLGEEACFGRSSCSRGRSRPMGGRWTRFSRRDCKEPSSTPVTKGL